MILWMAVATLVLPWWYLLQGKREQKGTNGKYYSTKWVGESPVGNMVRRQFTDYPRLRHEVKKGPIDLFEMVVTDDLVKYISQRINLYFKQSLNGLIYTSNKILLEKFF